ncbi:MAG: PQQ-binding-like beta-propeller repeat protein [Planctomycetaceae bacterium]|nr:PQQ-binding-like beta-propeller repeat protein [Planctomycetaceae bacterium]
MCLLLVGTLACAAEPRRSFLTADSSKQLIAIVGEDGQLKWTHRIGPLHDLHRLPNGNILFQTDWTKLIEIDPKSGETVWTYDSAMKNGNQGQRIEVHAFQRLANGLTMIAESGAARILEVDAQGKAIHNMSMQIEKPVPHQDTRLVRKIKNGNYLVCHENKGAVYEYSPEGKVVWSYDVPLFNKPRKPGHGVDAHGNQCFAALRLKNGNTLISTGNGHRVIEVTPGKDIVWALDQNELSGIQLAWVTTLQVLPSGNIVLGNCHAGPKNPQIIEINRAKQVVWKFHDFKNFGNSLTNTQILTVDGQAIR